MSRTVGTLIATAALVLSGGAAHAPAHTVTGVDDPSTFINEAAVLDASRVVTTGGYREPSPMEVAEKYAADNGLTCRAPADAELDDIILALAVGPDGLPFDSRVIVLTFDEGLAGTHHNLLACDTPKDTP